MVNQWLLSQRTTGLGLIYNSEIRPTYYVFQMYSHFGSEQVYSFLRRAIRINLRCETNRWDTYFDDDQSEGQ